MAKQIKIHGSIGKNWWTGEGVTHDSFKADFDAALATGDDIEILINSPGGSVFEGIAIYNTIAANNAKVTTVVEGLAASMGAVIALAGKKRKAYKNTVLMLHNCSGFAMGNAQDIEDTLQMMKALDNSLIVSVAQFTGLTEDEVKQKYFNYRDNTLTAAEALTAGLLTELIELDEPDDDDSMDDVKGMDLNQLVAHYKALGSNQKKQGFMAKLFNVFNNLVEPSKPEPTPAPNANDGAQNATPKPEEDMKANLNKTTHAAIIAALALQVDANAESVEVEITAQHLDTLNAALANAQPATPAVDVAALQNQIAELTNRVNALGEMPGVVNNAPVATANEGAATNKPTDDDFTSEADVELAALKAKLNVEIK